MIFQSFYLHFFLPYPPKRVLATHISVTEFSSLSNVFGPCTLVFSTKVNFKGHMVSHCKFFYHLFTNLLVPEH